MLVFYKWCAIISGDLWGLIPTLHLPMLPPVGTEMEDTMIKDFIIPLDEIGGPRNGWGHPNVKKNKYSTATSTKAHGTGTGTQVA